MGDFGRLAVGLMIGLVWRPVRFGMATTAATQPQALRGGGATVMLLSSRVGGRVLGAAVLGALYLLFIRPWLLKWGASDDEVRRECPGDWVVPDPRTVRTRAVTIRARSDQIWPWLAQMGAGRGGLYSYDWLDRLFGYTDAPSSDDTLPQFQSLAVGDVIPLGNGPSWPVIVADRNEALVVEPVTDGVSWAWILEVVDASTTRLISRVRLGLGHEALLLALAPAVDLPWFLMERKMLHGIKRRAEWLAQGPNC